MGTAGIVAGGQIGSPNATSATEFWNVPNNSTASLAHFNADKVFTNKMSVGEYTDGYRLGISPQSSSFRSHTNKPYIIPYVADRYYDTRQYVQTGSTRMIYSCGSCVEFTHEYLPTAESNFEATDTLKGFGEISIARDGILNLSFVTSSHGSEGYGKIPGAWSAGPDMITAVRANAFGQQNAAVFAGGGAQHIESSAVTCTQHYNGIGWSESANLPNARGSTGGGQGYGQAEDDIGLLNGYIHAPRQHHMQYNGHAWWFMQKNTSISTGGGQGATGTQNSALMFGGCEISPNNNTICTEEWNGHAWAAATAVIVNKRHAQGAGTQNATIANSGTVAPGARSTEFYDGTTWTEGPVHIHNAEESHAALAGSQNDALGHGANAPNGPSTTDTWDGTAWAALVTMPTVRFKAGTVGSSALGFVGGGGPLGHPNNPNASIATTVEWNNTFITGSYLLTKKIGSNFS